MFPSLSELLRDPHYPQYHISTDGGWLNDPHPLYFNNAWHMFYQHSLKEDEPYGGPHGWGHLVSTDLVHWKHLPDAITPRDHGIAPDHHIWSGTLVDNNGVGTAIYTIENIDVWVATSKDSDLRTFTKYPANPVIQGPPPGLKLFGAGKGEMRDPFVWREKDGWYLTVGSGRADNKGAVLPLYRSNDLIHWEYLHPLYDGRPDTDHVFCECPAFFPVGRGKYALFISHQAQWLVGRYENHRFIEETRGRSDYGFTYVPQIARDPSGRTIMWSWALDTRDRQTNIRAGWISMMTLPRVVTLGPDNTLRFDPAPELEVLRKEPKEFKNLTLTPEGTVLDGLQGAQLEFEATIQCGGAKKAGMTLYDCNTFFEIWYDVPAQRLHISGVNPFSAPLTLAKGEPLSLRVFFDGSIVEVYANHGVCLTERMYAPYPGGTMAKVHASGGPATANIRGWKLNSSWT